MIFFFAVLLTITTVGLVLNNEIKWISFHSGYDFGYLLKLLTCEPLPAEESDFFALMQLFFPCIYDIKFLMKSWYAASLSFSRCMFCTKLIHCRSCSRSLRGGLNDLAEDLDVDRYGPQHQAGSDSLLTAATFFKLREMFFENEIDDDKFLGVLYGLGGQVPPSRAVTLD